MTRPPLPYSKELEAERANMEEIDAGRGLTPQEWSSYKQIRDMLDERQQRRETKKDQEERAAAFARRQKEAGRKVVYK